MQIKTMYNKYYKIKRRSYSEMLYKIIIIFMIFMCISTFYYIQANENGINNYEMNNISQEVSNENLKNYTLEDPGMYIKIDANMIEIVSSIENNDEKINSIENKEQYKEYFQKSGIVLDAVNSIGESNDKEIIVVKSNNVAYQTMPNLNQFIEEDLNNYYEQFIESIKSKFIKLRMEIHTFI